MKRIVFGLVVLLACVVAWPHRATTPPPNLEATLAAQFQLVERKPGDPVVWNDLGNLLLLAGRDAGAEEAYRRSLELDPSAVAARFNLALLLQQIGRLEESEVELRRLLEVDHHHAWAHYQLGVVLAARKERKDALRHYARALAYDPSLSFAENNPHIIENALFTEALLLSQRFQEPPGTRVPRHYGDPDRIVGLMLARDAEAGTGDESTPAASEDVLAPAAEGGGGSAAMRPPGGASVPMQGAAPGAVRRPAAPAGEAVSPSSPGSQGTSSDGFVAAAPPAAVRPPAAADGGIAGGTSSGADRRLDASRPSAERPTTGAAAPSDPRTQIRRPRPLSSTGTPTVRPPASGARPAPPPPRRSRFIPGSQSSARLELELLPATAAPAATSTAQLAPGP